MLSLHQNVHQVEHLRPAYRLTDMISVLRAVAMAFLLTGVACVQDPPPERDQPAARAGARSEVLTISEREVTPGQVVEVGFDPPPNHEVWGVGGELWRERNGRWTRIASTYGWSGKPNMFTYWPKSDLNAFPDIGFGGSASWEWRVPRLRPGDYELRKEWLPKAPASPDRPVVTERAPFTVVGD